MADRLKDDILKHLEKKLNVKSSSIRVQLSLLKRKYSGLTLNAAAQLYAQKHGTSILPKLTEKDKASLASVQISLVPKREIKIPTAQQKTQKNFMIYATTDKFKIKHIEEINRAYNAGCYTATYILSRKIIENLITEILKKKIPSQTNLYFDTGRGRFRDFSEILKNFSDNKSAFPAPIHTAIDRLISKASAFKKEANDKAHSLFHIATKKELDDARVDEILALISSIN